MSFLMVYVMICYNISLNIGGMSNEVFLMAFGEMKIMWPVAFFTGILYRRQACSCTCISHCHTKWQTDCNHTCYFCYDHLHYVPIMSLIATILFKKCGFPVRCRMAPDHFHELPGSLLLAAYVLWTADPFSLREKCFRRNKMHKRTC